MEKGQQLQLLFPNAIYVVSQSSFDRALSPHYRDKASFIPELQNLLAQSKRLELRAMSHKPSAQVTVYDTVMATPLA